MEPELKEAIEFAKTLGVTRIMYESRHGGRVEVEFDQKQMVESAIPSQYLVGEEEGVSDDDLLFYSSGGR